MRILFLAVVGRVSAELGSISCSARLVGFCDSFCEVTVSFVVFKRASLLLCLLACLLLCSDGDGLAGAEVAHGDDSSFGISGTS